MGNKYDAVIFDLDGTLLDTTEGILNALKYAMIENDLPIPSDAVLQSFIGPPIEYSFTKLYSLEDDTVKDLADVFRQRYKNFELLKAKVYDGIYEVFEQLMKAGIKISIATYKRDDYARTLLRNFGFNKYTNVMHGADSKGILKKKDIIEICLKEMKIENYERVIMIGDSDNDANGAAEIGTAFVGVTYGFGFSESGDVEKFESVGIANTPLDLINIIL